MTLERITTLAVAGYIEKHPAYRGLTDLERADLFLRNKVEHRGPIGAGS